MDGSVASNGGGATAPAKTFQKEGRLVKEGGTVKSWKRRLFVLNNTTLNYYAMKKNGRGQEKGSIQLAKCSKVAPINYKKKKFCFELQTPHRNYYLMAADAQEMNEWVAILEEAVGVAREEKAKTAKPKAVSSEEKPAKTKVKVNDFEALKLIGRGSFGKVLQVKYIPTGQIFAMKILNKATIIARGELPHTKAEKSILTRLDCPFLVKLHYSFQTPDKLYFVMDFVNGGELFYHLQQEKVFDEDRTRFYSAEIVLGLEYLHKEGIVYRDLKPENLLLTNEGHVVMTDFGISKEGLHCSDDRTATFCGTPEYLAPEILKGQKYGKEVDWWSLGTLMFEMLNGLPPFYCEDVQQMYSKIMRAELKFPKKVSPEAASLIEGLLERLPTKRLCDPEQIKAHPYFASIDWEKLAKKQLKPPYIPPVRDASDTSCIDPAFTKDKTALSLTDGSEGGEAIHLDNFTYVAKSTLNK